MPNEKSYNCELIYNEFKNYLKSYDEHVFENGSKRLMVSGNAKTFTLDYISSSSGLSATATLVAGIIKDDNRYSLEIKSLEELLSKCISTIGNNKLRTKEEVQAINKEQRDELIKRLSL